MHGAVWPALQKFSRTVSFWSIKQQGHQKTFIVPRHLVASPNKKKNLQTKKNKILQSKKVSNTGLKSSLRAIEWYAYCLDYLYYCTPRYGFPKSNSTVPTFYNKLQWRGWYRVISFNDQVHTTHHPVLNFLGIYMSPVQWYPSLFWSTTAHSSGIIAYYGIDF